MRALLLFALLLAGCTASQTAQDGHDAGDAEMTTIVEVENRNFLDMNVYVLRSGQRVRLGRVGGNGFTEFELPEDIVRGASTLRFLADPVGGQESVSMEISIFPGDVLRLVIPPG